MRTRKATEVEKAAFNLFETMQREHEEKIKQSELNELERLKKKYELDKSSK